MHTSQEILGASLANARVMVQANLRDSNKWLVAAILAIYDRQTSEEQNTESTKEDNGVGFSGVDAQILSSFAQQILDFKAGKSRFRSPLSVRQLEIARAKMAKYAMQLVRIARAKEEARRRAAEALAACGHHPDAELALVEIMTDMGYRAG